MYITVRLLNFSHCFIVSSSEIQELYKRFQALDRGQYGVLCSKDIKLVPEIAMNPLCDRILALFNRSGDDVINFKDFVSIVWIFSANCPIHQKYEVAFEVFDIDQDNRISCDDLRWILRAMVGSNMDDEQLDQIVVKTIGSVDLDRVAFEQVRFVL